MTDYHLGDFIMALPTIEALAGYFEHGIDLAIRTAHRPLVERLPSAAKITILSYDAGRKARNLKQHLAFFKTCLKVMLTRYRTVFCVSYRIPCSMIALSTLAPQRIGLTSARRKWAFNDLLSPDGATHKLDFYATVLTRIGMIRRPPVVGPVADSQSRAAVAKIVLSLAGEDNRYAVVHPFSGQAVRGWPEERFLAIVDTLTEGYGLKVCLIGAPGERGQLETLRLQARHPEKIAVVAESIGTLIALLTDAALFFGNMSGPSHLAGLVGDAPIVCISGPTDKEKWKPLRHNCIRMLNGEVCPGKCLKQDCRVGYRCIMDVQVADAVAAIEDFFVQQSGGWS